MLAHCGRWLMTVLLDHRFRSPRLGRSTTLGRSPTIGRSPTPGRPGSGVAVMPPGRIGLSIPRKSPKSPGDGRAIAPGRVLTPGRSPIPGRFTVPGRSPAPGRVTELGKFPGSGRLPRLGRLVFGREAGREPTTDWPTPGRVEGEDGKFGREAMFGGVAGLVPGVSPPLGRLGSDVAGRFAGSRAAG